MLLLLRSRANTHLARRSRNGAGGDSTCRSKTRRTPVTMSRRSRTRVCRRSCGCAPSDRSGSRWCSGGGSSRTTAREAHVASMSRNCSTTPVSAATVTYGYTRAQLRTVTRAHGHAKVTRAHGYIRLHERTVTYSYTSAPLRTVTLVSVRLRTVTRAHGYVRLRTVTYG